jgi:hypothetical protein
MDSNIGVQGAMLIGTNEMITVRRLRMTPTKKEKKRQGPKRKNATLDQDIKGSKERKVPALVMWYLLVIDRLKIQHSVDGRQWRQFDLAH